MNRNNSQRRSRALQEYIEPYCNGFLSAEQTAEYERLLRDDPRVLDEFVLYMEIHSRLAWNVRAQGEDGRGRPMNTDEWKAKQEEYREAISSSATEVETAPSSPFPSLTHLHSPISSPFVGGPVFSYMVATLVLCAMLLGAWVYKISPVDHFPFDTAYAPKTNGRPAPIFVGQITGMRDCVWANNDTSTIIGAFIPFDRKYSLSSGLLEITYTSGARVILEGPCEYTVNSRIGGYLGLGKLTARVEKKVASGQWLAARNKGRGLAASATSAEPQAANPDPRDSSLTPHPSSLFTVTTPTATVTDLGTEFGVEVSENGDTTSRVFQGSVRVQTVGDGSQQNVVLRENESARVEGRGKPLVTVLGPSDKVADFIRRVPRRVIKTLDLVDVVAGGDGFSGRRDSGIDLSNGQITNLPQKGIIPVVDGCPEPLAGDGKYHRVTGTPFIDGVFIPDGDADAVQVDSAGHVFKWFRDTSNTTWRHIWAGAASRRDQNYLSKVADVDYASFPHGDMLFHANAAITFDLEVIRQANPGAKLLRFRATAANNGPEAIEFQCYADVWVLIDAKRRFQRRLMYNDQGVASVSVPIHDRDRFLTLAATDAGDAISHDWIIFGDPRLEMSAGDNGEQSKTKEVQP